MKINSSNPPLIPKPVRIQQLEGVFSLSRHSRFESASIAKPSTRILIQALEQAGGKVSETSQETGSTTENQVRLVEDEKLTGESHRIRITAGEIIVSAGPGGFPPAVATLRQLFLHYSPNCSAGEIPALEIEDHPAFGWRGLLLDCSRHFMRKETVLRQLDYLSLFKMNRLHWHLTDDQGWRIEIRKYPKLVQVGAWRGEENERYGGFYTQEDICEIVQFAADRGIVVVPEIDIPGHATAVLAAYPELGCDPNKKYTVETGWGIFENNLNAGDERVYTFLQDVLEEVIDLFPSPWIHLGGDECQKEPWERCPQCQAKIREEALGDEKGLQSYFISRVLKVLAKHGRMGIGWDEVREGGIPDNIILQAWTDHAAASEAARAGHCSIASPRDSCYFNYAVSRIDLAKVYAFDPIPEGLEAAWHHRILGGECHAWSEYISEQCLDYMLFPRLLAFAEATWRRAEDRQFEEFRERLSFVYPILHQLGIQSGPESSSGGFNAGILGRVDNDCMP